MNVIKILRFNYKIILSFILLNVWAMSFTNAQRFYSVVFNNLPQDFQLYPRNDKDEATVPISGYIELPGYTHMSVQVYRNNTLLKYLKAEIKYDSKGNGLFSTQQVIKAELAGYDFKVYACKSADSVLMVTRQKVVSGDVFIVMGQSNSTGFFIESDTSMFCRTFGKITGNLNTDPYNAADTLWALSNSPMTSNVGTMGLEIQKQLSKNSGIPNCLINGGFHWSSAYSHSIRNENNPEDMTTAYGRMLYRLHKSGMLKAARTFIYRQGETEMYNEGFDWETNFGILRDHLKLDLPALDKMYVFQMDIIYYPSIVGALLRDYQRRLPRIYPEIRTLATVGTQDFDGLHYGKPGNVQSGFELSRLIERDFYRSTDTVNINSPDVKKVYYKTAEQKELVMVFDEGQELIYPEPYKANDSVTLDIKDFIYLNNYGGVVASGTASENRVTLVLKDSKNADHVDYLLPYLQQGSGFYPYRGPYITNKRGMRAFTFANVSIGKALATPGMTAKLENSEIKTSWNAIADASGYKLERKGDSETTWQTIATLTETTFTDRYAGSATKLNYRLRALNPGSESAEFAFADVSVEVITGIEKEKNELFSAYPNPVSKKENLTVVFKKPANGTIFIFDKNGREVQKISIKNAIETAISPKRLDQGFYFLHYDSGAERHQKKVLITP